MRNALPYFVLLVLAITVYVVWTPFQKTVLSAAVSINLLFPEGGWRPLILATKDPFLQDIKVATDDGDEIIVRIVEPVRPYVPQLGIVINTPLIGGGLNDSRLMNMAGTFARAGVPVAIPWDAEDGVVVNIDDVDEVVAAARELRLATGVENLGLFGISYGSGPVFAAATDERLAGRVAAVISLNGYFDLREVVSFIETGGFAYRGVSGQLEPHAYTREVLAATRAAYSEEEITALLDTTSVASHIQNVEAPVFIVHSTDDSFIPYTQSMELYDALMGAGVESRLVLTDVIEHGTYRPVTFGNVTSRYWPAARDFTGMVYEVLSAKALGGGPMYRVPEESITFLSDETYVGDDGERRSDQEIFNRVMEMIRGARRYVLVDMFLYNDFQGSSPEETRALADELTAALIEKKQGEPAIEISVVSDPINTVYGGVTSSHFEHLREAGITVVITDLSQLPDSNPLYSIFWRSFIQWFGNSSDGGFLPHPFAAGGERVTLRSWLSLLNFKANHRKVIVADQGEKLVSLMTSANPHDGSSAHSNVAVAVADDIWRDVVASEQAVAAFSGGVVPLPFIPTDVPGDVRAQLLVEEKIRTALLGLIGAAGEGDSIEMVMFYLSDRSIVQALEKAAGRGAHVRLVLDPNKDAFGHTKNGVPNRPVAHELVSDSNGKISIRWCDTHGEQCHSKLMLFRIGDVHTMVAGSANVTRRNIGGYNLETNVLVSADREIPAIGEARAYFQNVWENREGRVFTTHYSTYADDSVLKTVLYRVQEAAGLSSF